MPRHSHLRWAALATFLLALPVLAADKVTFKPVPVAVLKIDDRPAKTWNVYAAEKGNLILIQLGRRFLMLDTELREVWELDPARIERKGKNLRWEKKEQSAKEAQRAQSEDKARTKEDGGGAAPPAQVGGGVGTKPVVERVLPSEEWNIRDAGRARIVRLRLAEEGRVLELQLPIAPDQRFY